MLERLDGTIVHVQRDTQHSMSMLESLVLCHGGTLKSK